VTHHQLDVVDQAATVQFHRFHTNLFKKGTESVAAARGPGPRTAASTTPAGHAPPEWAKIPFARALAGGP
ncbi:hypothetical protein, partial [Stenotrophomonas maltophilia group sp. RNC7]|uniref:hypothetical protein n=1 Tax=Stenotrophomonas maltophilia group sp. RNC7 TaxID=3071467 RepID=UPI0027DFD1D7